MVTHCNSCCTSVTANSGSISSNSSNWVPWVEKTRKIITSLNSSLNCLLIDNVQHRYLSKNFGTCRAVVAHSLLEPYLSCWSYLVLPHMPVSCKEATLMAAVTYIVFVDYASRHQPLIWKVKHIYFLWPRRIAWLGFRWSVRCISLSFQTHLFFLSERLWACDLLALVYDCKCAAPYSSTVKWTLL